MSKTIDKIKEAKTNFNNNITQRVKSNTPLQLRYVLGVYFLTIFFMMIFRVVIFFVHCATTLSDLNIVMLLRSLLQGIRFDSLAVCRVFMPFLLLMFVFALTNYNRRWFLRPLHIILTFLCSLLFLIHTLDAAYFTYFQSHINIIVLSWMKTPKYLFEVLLHSPIYLLYIIVFLGSVIWFLWLMYCLYNATLFKTIPPYNAKQPVAKVIVVGLILFGLCFIGIRGKITEKNPVTMSSAYFSDNDFFNQLGVSPVFSILKSFEEEKEIKKNNVPYIDPIKAREIVAQEFANCDDILGVMPELKEKTNILFVVMEGITSKDISRQRTPNLYRVSTSSLNFTNVYADGEHSYNGLFSILFAYPNIFSNNSMVSTVIPKMNGLPTLLKQYGYKTFFFTSKAQKTDNTTRYLLANDIDIIFSGKANDLKKDAKALTEANAPFFACVFVSKDNVKNHIKASDKKVGQVLNEAKKYSWFKNTLIVFVGANGYNTKVPLYFYAPKMFKAEKNNTIACQMDIMPTILAMLDKDYKNETMGLNIYTERRSFAFSSKQDEMTVRNNNFVYTWNKNKKYEFKNIGTKDTNINTSDTLIKVETFSDEEMATKMKEYVFSMFQASEYNIAQKKMKKQ